MKPFTCLLEGEKKASGLGGRVYHGSFNVPGRRWRAYRSRFSGQAWHGNYWVHHLQLRLAGAGAHLGPCMRAASMPCTHPWRLRVCLQQESGTGTSGTRTRRREHVEGRGIKDFSGFCKFQSAVPKTSEASAAMCTASASLMSVRSPVIEKTLL